MNPCTSFKLTADVSPENAANRTVCWSSSKPSVATVDSSGKVCALSVGTAVIYATANDGSGQRDCCTITVTCDVLTNMIIVNPMSKQLYLNDIKTSSTTLSITVFPATAVNQGVTWKSSDTSVATVNSSGLVMARMTGSTIITATAKDGSGAYGCCIVSVDSEPKERVTIKEVYEPYGNGSTYKTHNITFSNGLVWKCIHEDMSLDNPYESVLPQSLRDRARDNNQLNFSSHKLAYLYRIDPYGVIHYVKNSYDRFGNMPKFLFFKDKLYKEIFGQKPELFRTFKDGSISWYKSFGELPPEQRLSYYSEAEIIFGSHVILDVVTLAEAGIIVLDNLLGGFMSETLSSIFTAVELTNLVFFSGSVVGVVNGAPLNFLQAYVGETMELSKAEKMNSLLSWVGVVFNTLRDLGEYFTQNIVICKKMRDLNYNMYFQLDNTNELSIVEVVDCLDN